MVMFDEYVILSHGPRIMDKNGDLINNKRVCAYSYFMWRPNSQYARTVSLDDTKPFWTIENGRLNLHRIITKIHNDL